MSATLPPEAPATEPLERVRDRLIEWTLRHRLTEHPAISALADLYARRISGDEPTVDEWRMVRDALVLTPDRAHNLDLDRALDLAIDLAIDLDFALDRATDRALARALASLLGARLVPIPDLDAQILQALDAGRWTLDMATYHFTDAAQGPAPSASACGTTHCRAGSAIVLHPLGHELERVFGSWLAGAAIYLRSTGAVPNFFAQDDEAMADMRRAAGGGAS